MALPFLRKKQVAGLIMAKRKPDGSNEVMENQEEKSEQDYDSSDLKACAEDLIRAVENKDVDGVAAALKAAHDICDSQPHEEYSEEEGQE